MKLSIFVFKSLSTLALSSVLAKGQFIDVSTWDIVTLNVSSQGAANWTFSNGGTTAVQNNNADVSFLLSGVNQSDYRIGGTFRVNTAADDDFIGFVFGYQDTDNHYVFGWKQASQTDPVEGPASQGFSIRKIQQGLNGPGAVEGTDYWNDAGGTHSAVLATNFGPGTGWADNTDYEFELRSLSTGQFTITIEDSASNVLWNQTLVDNTWTSGQFGFYNYSQEQVEYSGFTESAIPEPSTLGLIGLGSVLLLRRRRQTLAS